ncbi:hypothetical protein Mapa_015181 [Marchantia paleacea]|nr:hypothetical protein Mapa_015181 [Marchantia paleacea]
MKILQIPLQISSAKAFLRSTGASHRKIIFPRQIRSGVPNDWAYSQPMILIKLN